MKYRKSKEQPEFQNMFHPQHAAWDENNLLEWPFAVLAYEPPPVGERREFSDKLFDKKLNKEIERHWSITPEAGLSLPCASDELIYLAFATMTSEQYPLSPVVRYSRGALCERLGWGRGGRAYERLEDGIRRLLGVTIHSSMAFRHSNGSRATFSFHIIDEALVGDARMIEQDTYIRWSEAIFTSFKHGNFNRKLDLDACLSLPTPKSVRLYRYLSRKYDGQRKPFEINIERLAFERMGLSRKYTHSRLRKELAEASDPLVDMKLLEKYEFGTMNNGALKVSFHWVANGLRKPKDAIPSFPAPNNAMSHIESPCEPKSPSLTRSSTIKESIAVLETINPLAGAAAREAMNEYHFKTQGMAYHQCLLEELRKRVAAG